MAICWWEYPKEENYSRIDYYKYRKYIQLCKYAIYQLNKYNFVENHIIIDLPSEIQDQLVKILRESITKYNERILNLLTDSQKEEYLAGHKYIFEEDKE